MPPCFNILSTNTTQSQKQTDHLQIYYLQNASSIQATIFKTFWQESSVKKMNMSAGKMETCTEDIDRFTWQNYFSALYQQYNKHWLKSKIIVLLGCTIFCWDKDSMVQSVSDFRILGLIYVLRLSQFGTVLSLAKRSLHWMCCWMFLQHDHETFPILVLISINLATAL